MFRRNTPQAAKVEDVAPPQRTYHQQFADALLEHMPDACFVIVDGLISDVNPGMERLFAGSRDALIGASPGALSPEMQPDGTSSAERAEVVIKEVLEKGFKRFEWVHRRLNGEDFLARVNLFLCEIDGNPSMVCSLADISEIEAMRRERAARDASEAKRAEETTQALESVNAALERLRQGDLSTRLGGRLPNAFVSIGDNFDAALETMDQAVQGVGGRVRPVLETAEQVDASAKDLASRSQQQAAYLEETAASVEEVAASVKENAGAAASANVIVRETLDGVGKSRKTAHEAIQKIQEIESSSKEISMVVTLIDDIAFQTNLLALNASVEAARAGEQGRGFAVVASEVRALAQRCADAAKEISKQILTSGDHVAAGVRLVNSSGAALEDMVEQISRLRENIESISNAAEEQSRALTEINTAVSGLDTMTQKNAALAEQSTTASREFNTNAHMLKEAILGFQTSSHVAERGVNARAAGMSHETHYEDAEPLRAALS